MEKHRNYWLFVERIAEENKAKKEAILKKIEELKEETNKL